MSHSVQSMTDDHDLCDADWALHKSVSKHAVARFSTSILIDSKHSAMKSAAHVFVCTFFRPS